MNTDHPPSRERRSTGRLSRLAGAVTARVVETIDPDTVIDHLDLDHLIEQVDLNRMLDRVDIDRLLDRVDMDRLLERVDVDRLLRHVDVNELVNRVDIDTALAGVDLEAAARRAGIPEIVAESTGRVAGSVLDLVRRQLVGLDVVVDHVLSRTMRRDPSQMPVGPPKLMHRGVEDRTEARTGVSGHYAGAASRAIAAAIDVVAVVALFTAGVAGIDLLARVVLNLSAEPSGLAGTISFVVWVFLYLFLGQAIVGRTLGKTVVGLRVVSADGSTLSGTKALARTAAFPLSAMLAGLGFAGIVVGRKHRALHDLIASTAVVYDWGTREAQIPVPLTEFLARRAGTEAGQM